MSAVMIATFLVVAPQLFFKGTSADLLATWLAADAYAAGQFNSVYAPVRPVFTMTPPEGWVDRASALGHHGPVYPFLYPPLIAALLAPLTRVIELPAFIAAASAINTGLIVASIILGARIAGYRPEGPLFIAIALGALCLSKVGLLAMFQNQPQILVVFLLLLAIERVKSNRANSAGLALAAAAAIKVYPALFILAFAIQRQWRAALSFILAGATLASASVWVAGWPLHEVFLAQLRSVNNTIVVSMHSYHLHSPIALYGFRDALQPVTTATTHREMAGMVDWFVMPRPAIWQTLGTLALLVSVILAGLWMRIRPEALAPTWAGLICLFSLIMPMSWAYYYLPSLILSPVLITRLGPLAGGVCIALAVLGTALYLPERLAVMLDLPQYGILPAFAGLFVLLTGFCVAAVRPAPKPARAAAPSQSGQTAVRPTLSET